MFFLITLFLKINYSSNKPIQPFGITTLKVMSNSMNPAIEKGNRIIIKKQKDYVIGDIITYINEDGNLITHRIIEKYGNEFITKGDNNNTKDNGQIKIEQIIGKVIFVLFN